VIRRSPLTREVWGDRSGRLRWPLATSRVFVRVMWQIGRLSVGRFAMSRLRIVSFANGGTSGRLARSGRRLSPRWESTHNACSLYVEEFIGCLHRESSCSWVSRKLKFGGSTYSHYASFRFPPVCPFRSPGVRLQTPSHPSYRCMCASSGRYEQWTCQSAQCHKVRWSA
jgi:hypothetical protein